MSHRRIAGALLLLGTAVFVGCQSKAPIETAGETSELKVATSVYRDYERGDCKRVGQRVRPEAIRDWDPTEVRHASVLVRGFCQERDGDTSVAKETYRSLIQEAPLSFASDDARERLRIIRLTERDPHYKAWVESARDRYNKQGARRVPVDRISARFPPLAQHAEIEGYAIVEFGITPRGDIDSPVIVESEPPLLFDGAALRAVREWRYNRDPNSTDSLRQVIRIVFRPVDAQSILEEPPGSSASDDPEP